MKEIKFGLIEKSKAGKLYLDLEYMGGDADIEIHEQELLDGITWDNYRDNLQKIEELVKKWKIVKNLDFQGDYNEIKEEYGEEIASMWENGPNDATSDYQWKCQLDDIELIAYDNEGNKYRSYI